jgi:hypothetical protein
MRTLLPKGHDPGRSGRTASRVQCPSLIAARQPILVWAATVAVVAFSAQPAFADSADLRLSGAVTTPPKTGQVVVVGFTIENLGPDSATNVKLSQDANYAFTVAAPSPGCPIGTTDGLIQCQIGTIPAGTSVQTSLSLTVNPLAKGRWSADYFAGTADQTDPVLSNSGLLLAADIADGVAPSLNLWSVSPRAFRPGVKRDAAIISKTKRGAQLNLALSEPSRVDVKFERVVKSGQSRQLPGGFSFDNRGQVVSSVRLTGSLNGKRLKPGVYYVVGTPTDAAGNVGSPARALFKIKRSKKRRARRR